MTAVYTVDVHCDLPGCHRHEHGSTDRTGVASVGEARARLKRQGWRHRVVDTGHGHRIKVDLCPAHSDFDQASLSKAFSTPEPNPG